MTDAGNPKSTWPTLPRYSGWRDTCVALHLWTQIVGKYRLAHTPWMNHSWHATLYVTPRGLTTGIVPDGNRSIALSFDFHDHQLIAQADSGATGSFPLDSMSVAEFFSRTKEIIEAVGGSPRIHENPSELPDPVPFPEDTEVRDYDRTSVGQYHSALVQVHRVFEHFRTSYLGKVSPVHLFWGAFDLAVTRFSGRSAPPHPGGIPNLPDSVTREAYSHEVSSAGFWPGGDGIEEAMFYSYAYPEPVGFRSATVKPAASRFDADLGEFLLPYAAVQSSDDPDGTLLAFLQSTYQAASESGGWDRTELECEIGQAGVPRSVE